MDGWNTTFLLGWPIFRGYVSFREGRVCSFRGMLEKFLEWTIKGGGESSSQLARNHFFFRPAFEAVASGPKHGASMLTREFSKSGGFFSPSGWLWAQKVTINYSSIQILRLKTVKFIETYLLVQSSSIYLIYLFNLLMIYFGWAFLMVQPMERWFGIIKYPSYPKMLSTI